LIERAEQEIKRQYLARSRYAVKIKSTITPLERNRVAVALAIDEGNEARITHIRIVGQSAFSEAVLLDQLTLSTPTWLSWYTKTDQYSREKLSGDLERLRSFYLSRGFLEFSIDATQVAIDRDREGVFITINITEGERFTVSNVDFSGNTLGRETTLRKLMRLQHGEVFNGERLNESTRDIIEMYGAMGYAFANVNAIPKIDRTTRTVAFDVAIDPGRRSYVRRIHISGNNRTRDEVIRRELRQFESAWYDADKIRLSRERLNRLGYFSAVDIDTVPVPGASDQVDLQIRVTERSTGSFMLGVGFSSTDRVVLTTSVNQQNFLGTGKTLGVTLNTGRTQQALEFRTTDPYFTKDGVSRSFDVYSRRFNADTLRLGDYRLQTQGLGVRFGVPYTEVDRILFGLGYERSALNLGVNAPQRFKEYVAEYGDSSWTPLASLGWSRDSRDSPISPTRGFFASSNLEAALPVGDLRYGRADFSAQWYRPLNKDYTLGFSGLMAHGWAMGGTLYPVFKNYYAGGIGSIRGFEPASLGPRDTDGYPRGGRSKFVLNAEFLFPMPGAGNAQQFRLFGFLDVGNVFPSAIEFNDLRASSGLGLTWLSPVGPLKLSLGVPLIKEPNDRLQRFQFQIGTGF
jgi:outer membrane protein insertion porin family